MNLRNWSMDHTKGLILGLVSPLVFIPIVLLLLSWLQNFQFSQLLYKFEMVQTMRSKVISIAIISNLLWFYLSINREKFSLGMGVIVATFCYLPDVVYVNFFS